MSTPASFPLIPAPCQSKDAYKCSEREKNLVCAHGRACGDQESVLGVNPQTSAILLTETRFLIGLEPERSPVFASAMLELETEAAMPNFFFFNVCSEHQTQACMLIWSVFDRLSYFPSLEGELLSFQTFNWLRLNTSCYSITHPASFPHTSLHLEAGNNCLVLKFPPSSCSAKRFRAFTIQCFYL